MHPLMSLCCGLPGWMRSCTMHNLHSVDLRVTSRTEGFASARKQASCSGQSCARRQTLLSLVMINCLWRKRRNCEAPAVFRRSKSKLGKALKIQLLDIHLAKNAWIISH